MADWSFDRAADFYDATRSLPDAVLAEVSGILGSELIRHRPVLEIGVGTGRIALPLHRRGIQLVGTDISSKMVGRLVANAGGGKAPFPLALADATSLPFADGQVGAVVASHVLHLVPAWELAVDESMRVLRLGGVLLVDFGGGVVAPWGDKVGEFFARHGVRHVRPGVSHAEDLVRHLGDRVVHRPLKPVKLAVTRSLVRDLSDWEAQIHSWTWQYPPEQMRAACHEVRRWALEEDILDDEVELDRVIQWWAFDKAA